MSTKPCHHVYLGICTVVQRISVQDGAVGENRRGIVSSALNKKSFASDSLTRESSLPIHWVDWRLAVAVAVEGRRRETRLGRAGPGSYHLRNRPKPPARPMTLLTFPSSHLPQRRSNHYLFLSSPPWSRCQPSAKTTGPVINRHEDTNTASQLSGWTVPCPLLPAQDLGLPGVESIARLPCKPRRIESV